GFPCARSLLLPSVGVSAFFGVLLMGGVDRRAELGWSAKLLLPVLATLLLVASPLGWLSATRVHGGATLAEEQVFQASELDGIAGQRVIVLSSPDPVMAGYLGVRAALLRKLQFESWLVLSHSQVSHRIERTGDNEFVLEQTAPPPPYFEDVFRDPNDSETLGNYQFSYFSSHPEEVLGTWRKRVRFTFTKPLDDTGYVFLTYRDGAMRRVSWPAVGQALDLPYEKGPWNLM
ncbi:MAG TPA: hypothetical protein VLC09_06340, partial [Polyangiaceae bacterium]|nr:hypothetical protein [Polyangiaceae bacterium]